MRREPRLLRRFRVRRPPQKASAAVAIHAGRSCVVRFARALESHFALVLSYRSRLYRNASRLARNFRVARNSEFFAVSSDVPSKSPMARKRKPLIMLHLENHALARRKPASLLPESACRVPGPGAAFPDSPRALIRAGDQRNRACRRLQLPPGLAPDPRGGWCGGGDDRAPHSSRCGKAKCKSCIRTGTGANSGRHARSFPGRCRGRLRSGAPDSSPAAARRGRSVGRGPRKPDGLPPVPYGRALAPPRASLPLPGVHLFECDGHIHGVHLVPNHFGSALAKGFLPRPGAFLQMVIDAAEQALR